MGRKYALLAALFGAVGGMVVGTVGSVWATRDGSGNYTLPAGNPVVSGTQISTTWANNTLNDIAASLTSSLAKDGQTTPTANLPMGNFRHTGVADAASRNNYASAGQVQDSALNLASSVAGTNTLTASLAPAPAAYANGMQVGLIPVNSNSGATTLSLNGLTARSVVKSNGTALIAGDLLTGAPALLIYDLGNVRWNLINPQSMQTNVALLNADNSLTGVNTIIAAAPTLRWNETDQGADQKLWQLDSFASAFRLTSRTDAGSVIATPWSIAHDGSAYTIAATSITLTGSVTLGTDLAVTEGGTGASTAAGARTNLGLGSLATLSAINDSNWSGTALAIGNGGTGSTTAANARTALGVTATGADTAYAFRANNLSDLGSSSTARANLGVTATGADTTYNVRASNLSDVANAATARTNLGIGSMATRAITIQSGGSASGGADGDLVLIY